MTAILMLVALLALPFLLVALLIVAARREARRHPWQFRVSDVVSQAFVALGRARTPILLTSLFLTLPGVGLQMALGIDPGSSMFQLEGQQLGAFLTVSVLIGLLLGTLGQLIITALALEVLAGRPAVFREALARAARLLVPAVVVQILWWIGVSFGLMLLIVPGLILMLSWAIVLPVLVAEGAGIFGSFSRSGELMRGARWRLLLLLAVVAVVWSLFGGVGQGFLLASTTDAGRTFGVVIQALVTTLSSALTATGLSAIYHQLKSQREGLVGEDLEAVFA